MRKCLPIEIKIILDSNTLVKRVNLKHNIQVENVQQVWVRLHVLQNC